jgi:adenylate cyclase
MRKKLIHSALLWVLVVMIVEAATWTGWLPLSEEMYYDLWHRLAGQRYTPEHVVIVSLDDQSLQDYPDDPLVTWTPHFAHAIAVLRRVGVRVIGLDYLYYVSMESWLKKLDLPGTDKSRTYDIPLREQLGSGQVVMAARLTVDNQKNHTVLKPIKEYFYSLPRGVGDIGLINLYYDNDEVIRRFPIGFEDSREQVWFAFAKLLTLKARQEDPFRDLQRHRRDPAFLSKDATDSEAWEESFLPLIGFVGPPGTFPRLSFRRLLSRDAELDPEIKNLKDKIVILAYEPTYSQDIHLTPYGLGFFKSHTPNMGGAEVHANIIETLLSGQAPRPLPNSLTFFYLLLILAAGTVLVFRLSSWQGLVIVCLGCLGGMLLSYFLFLKYWLLPVVNLQFGLLLSYIGALGVRVTGEERERRRLRQLFGRYVSDEVVEKIMASGKRPDLSGEALRISVLFSDIRNFTTISERLSPRQVVEMLNAYFTQVCEPILEQGGTVDKFIGDAVMAIFGSPVPNPDHARRALQAALDIAALAQEFRTWMQDHFAEVDLPDFRVGIGLHTGEAIVGSIGSPKRLEFTSIGDTINTASRLEGLSKELGWIIVASSDIIKAAGPGVVLGRSANRQVKGRREPVEVFEVLGLEVEITS